MSNSRPNPYVGPRSFRTGEKMYGRERETLELLDLVIAERIVLLYSPSGAGKTSLIQAALVPKLQEEGFNVTRPIRVSSEPPVLPPPPGANPERAATTSVNRFVLSTLLSLEEPLPQAQRLPLAALAGLSFDEYLKQRGELGNKSPVLIFDQFEEILTLEPTNLAAKFAFFEQVGEALRNRGRWALFSMREDYLAGLDPYLLPIPTRFTTTYRLDLLGTNAAREAIQKPARGAGVDFTDAAANKLVNDLSQIRIQRPDGTMELQAGPYVEPVQLQVVCYRLWDKLPDTKNEIVESDLTQVGDVNTALADYYAASVKNIAATSGEKERVIREWFDRQLITEQGIRGQVLMEPERSRGLANTAIRGLVNAHLVRADERRGATWYELAHDRLIEPVRKNNAAWFQENLSALQRDADLWDRSERPEGMLLRGKALQEAETWAQAHANELTPTEQAYLSECRQARLVKEKEEKQNRRIRYLAIGATVLSVIALFGICATLIFANQLGASLSETEQARTLANKNAEEANTAKLQAQQQERVSKMTNASLSQLTVDPEVSLLLAMQAYSTTQSVETDDILRQAVTESRVRGTLRGHTDSVDSVATSPDGKYFATGSGDQTAIIWDAANGKQVYVLKGHTAPIWTVAFSPDGKTLLTTSEDTTARLWDLSACKDGTCAARELKGHTQAVWGGAFSPTGDEVVTVGNDGIAKLWRSASGEFLGDIAKHAQAINAAAFSPDGRYLVTASADQTAQITDLTTCQGTACTGQTFEGQAALWNVAFSPDSKYVVVASDDQNAYKINLATNSSELQLSGHSDAVLGTAYSPDGKYIATGSRDGTARVWDANTGQAIAILRGHDNSVWSVAFTPDSRLLLTGSADTTARLWDISDSAALRVLRGHFNKVLGADYSGDGKRVISVGADGEGRVWDVETGTIIANLVGHEGWVSDGALNQDGSRAATASFDTTARIWDLASCEDIHGDVNIDSKCKFTELQGHADVVRSVTFSPDGKFVLTASDDLTARLWDAATGALVKTFEGHEGPVNHAVFGSDGKEIVTASNDRTAIVWDVETGEPKIVLRGHAGPVTNASFNHDATQVATASEDRTARIWDIANCKQVGSEADCPFKELKGHSGAVTGAVFTQDGKFVVTGSADKTARVWDTTTDETISILRGHTDKIQTVELSPDDQSVLTASSDKTVRIVPRRIEDILAIARTRITRALSCDEWLIAVGDPDYCPGGGIAQNAIALPTLAPITRVAVESNSQPVVGASTATPIAPTVAATTAPSPTAQPTVDLSVPSGGGGSTVLATVTAAPTVTAASSPPPSPTRAASPTPNVAPGVYISRIVYQPLGGPNFQFKVTFLNTTDAPVTYSKWLVPFFEPGAKNSMGAPKGVENTIPVGTSEQLTETWKVGVGQCTPFTAKPVSQDQDGRQTPFALTNGQPATLDFQLCP
ncbi:MAG: hypothetical protein EYC68_12760 [Chloroflexota bacterium]|nr:MAG: hypothetical protein EYC68_12760 [Chloroflexota bacterium]